MSTKNTGTPKLPKPPRAPRRNPFKAGSLLAKQFDAVLEAHRIKHRDLMRGRGNAFASAFWKGYDNVPPFYPHDSLAWACYRAGQFAALSTQEKA